MSDKKDTAASLGYSEELSVKHSPCERIPAVFQEPEEGTKGCPPSCERTPGTFSQRTHLGSTSRTARAYSSMRRPRGSSSPLRLPATLNAWHGLPPMMRSHFPRYELQSTPLTSPRLGTAGNLFSNSSQQNGSISANAMGSHPRGPHATLAASMPENRLMYLISRTTPPRS